MKSIRPLSAVSVHDLSVDQFNQISDWYHSAILEIVNLTDFESSAERIAKRLGISKIEVEVAVERLIRRELLEKDEAGKLVRTQAHLVTRFHAVQNRALRNFFAQSLQKAAEAPETQTPPPRINGYETALAFHEHVHHFQAQPQPQVQSQVQNESADGAPEIQSQKAEANAVGWMHGLSHGVDVCPARRGTRSGRGVHGSWSIEFREESFAMGPSGCFERFHLLRASSK